MLVLVLCPKVVCNKQTCFLFMDTYVYFAFLSFTSHGMSVGTWKALS